jgi:ribosome-binding factor A
MPSLRTERVRELLKREIGEIIRREIPMGDAGLVSVNDVRVSSDLHSASVYLGVLGNEIQRKKALSQLNTQKKRIQSLVGQAVILKYTPHLRFLLDDSVSEGNKVLKILEELEKTSPSDENTPEDH